MKNEVPASVGDAAVRMCREEALRDAMAGVDVHSRAYGQGFRHRVAATAGLLDVQRRMAEERERRQVVIETENARGEARRVVVTPHRDRQVRPDADRMRRGTDGNRSKS